MSWVCPMCSTSNLDKNLECVVCGTLNQHQPVVVDLKRKLLSAIKGVKPKQDRVAYSSAYMRETYDRGLEAYIKRITKQRSKSILKLLNLDIRKQLMIWVIAITLDAEQKLIIKKHLHISKERRNLAV